MMLSSFNLNHASAWIYTLVFTGIVSYFTLKLSIIDWETGEMPQEKQLRTV